MGSRGITAALAGILLIFAVSSQGSAQPDPTADRVVVADDGSLWLIRNGTRHWLSPLPVSQDVLGLWTEGEVFGDSIPQAPVPTPNPTSIAAVATNILGGDLPDTPAGWRRTIGWQGSGDKTTEPFTIQAREWRVAFTMTDPRRAAPSLCFSVRTLDTARVAGGCYKHDDTTYIYKTGTFFLDVTTTDVWSIAVEEITG